MNRILGIVDEPNPRGSDDFLGVGKHASALTKFIELAPTPITIGIQGEWGSGKTSVLNAIYHELDRKGTIKQIWINSWESSLLSTPEEALIKIINEILNELIGCDVSKSQAEKIRQLSSNVFKGALRIGASVALGQKAGEVTDELLGQQSNSIKQLRENLASITMEIMSRPTNKFDKIVVYVDDLDRIEPRDAVRVLELLKNIFNVTGCVFVLAIDYQVVVKGLESKFGKQSEENEWEFRAFFDKIIQLPFMMPIGQYDIGKYVGNLLQQIEFATEDEIEEQTLNAILGLSVGGNPRSLKRLVNSISLIMIFMQEVEDNGNKDILDDPSLKTALFALLCIQIAYPKIYDLLVKEPRYIDWNDDTAFQQTKQLEEVDNAKFKKDFELAIKTKDFDEVWEQALYRICYNTPRYRRKVTEISRLLSYIKDDILQDSEDTLEEVMGRLLGETSVTTISANEEQSHGKAKYQKTNYVDWDIYEKTILKDLYSLSKEQIVSTKGMHDKLLICYGDDVEVRYTKTVISFRKKSARGRQKVACYYNVRNKDFYIPLMPEIFNGLDIGVMPAKKYFKRLYDKDNKYAVSYQAADELLDDRELQEFLRCSFSKIK